MIEKIEPHDLMKFGLIPELIGRLPAIVGLRSLDEDALVRILTEPKNALVKQYQKLFALDGVKLVFEPDALCEVAKIAVERNTRRTRSARRTRGRDDDVMFDPVRQHHQKVVITRDVVLGTAGPEVIHRTGGEDGQSA